MLVAWKLATTTPNLIFSLFIVGYISCVAPHENTEQNKGRKTALPAD